MGVPGPGTPTLRSTYDPVLRDRQLRTSPGELPESPAPVHLGRAYLERVVSSIEVGDRQRKVDRAEIASGPLSSRSNLGLRRASGPPTQRKETRSVSEPDDVRIVKGGA